MNELDNAIGIITDYFSSVTNKRDVIKSVKYALEEVNRKEIMSDEQCILFLMYMVTEIIDIDTSKRKEAQNE